MKKKNSGETIKQISCHTSMINDQSLKYEQMTLELIDTGADLIIIAPESWHLNCPLQEVNVQLLKIRNISHIKQSRRRVKCIEPEGQRRKFKLYVAKIKLNFCGHYLLHWNT